ncbi:hypothetical protein HJ588_17625 [Flexivirga sp. ID2601S]|uniref:Acetone carboxylase n=1 Tax=Flexivirga aerilata TaxID=1656889 RepID=A0A849AWN7_9MICO|nr:hypothetical protein [Flexivirga aerilata]NNG41082.1 hypothetical protein [Flexivirga aerilata]
MSLPLPGAQPAARQCSAKGCRRDAAYAILWRNPKIHDEDRRKTWLACEEHRASLSDFLSLRAFPMEVVPIAEVTGD